MLNGWPTGIIYGAMRLCSFSGLYYCSDCHCDDEAIIPARVFLNGDWSRRKVCRAVHQFFSDVQLEPLLDAIEYNRNIYSIETEFREVLTLRSQLVHLSAYLLTCRSDAKELFCTKMLDKEHIYREEHTYTLADLPCVQSGQLRQHLLKVQYYYWFTLKSVNIDEKQYSNSMFLFSMLWNRC